MDDRQQQKNIREQKSNEALDLSLVEQVGDKGTLDSVIEHYRSWLPKYQELAQGRSNFQIEKMIATEHATPAASYQHTLYQLRVLHQALMNDFIEGIEKIREFEYKWKDKSHTEPQWWKQGKQEKLCWYDTDRLRHEHEIEELKMSVKDKLLQMETFTKVLKSMEEAHGGTFTQAELNAEEPEYWKLRLARQMGDSYLDQKTGLGSGNIRSLRMGLADSPIPESQNRIEDFPDIFNAVLGGPEAAKEVINEVNELLFTEMNTLGKTSAERKQIANDTKSQPETSTQDTSDAIARLRSIGIGLADES